MHRIVIDYSRVTFYTPTEAASALATALGTGAAASDTTVTVSSDLTIAADKTVTVFDGVTLSVSANNTLTVPAGKTITNNGTITLGTGSKLVLTGADGTDGAKITGAGKLVAANTEITGEWQAVGASGTVTITATDADESEITGVTSVLTAGADGVITQNAAASNNLTIAANTTINLGGTEATTPVGKISLTKGSNPGKLTLSAATSVIYTLAAKTDGAVYSSSLTSIDTDIVITDISKAEVFQASNKLTKLTGDSDGASITAVASGTGTNDIDSTTDTAGT